jgi:hypothetical protein
VYRVNFVSLKSAERNGGGRAYLARLVAGPDGSVDRQFANQEKRGKNRRSFASNALPGDVFEARRWTWDSLRQQYSGGTLWFGVQQNGTLCRLNRDEAFQAVLAVAIAAERPQAPDHRPVERWATRVVPEDLQIFPVETSGQALIDAGDDDVEEA